MSWSRFLGDKSLQAKADSWSGLLYKMSGERLLCGNALHDVLKTMNTPCSITWLMTPEAQSSLMNFLTNFMVA